MSTDRNCTVFLLPMLALRKVFSFGLQAARAIGLDAATKQLSPPVGLALVCHRLPRAREWVAINIDVPMFPNSQEGFPNLFGYG
jgi:hypothetical protein